MNIKFFFQRRRRHTRWPRDWSSDVCSPDLGWPGPRRPRPASRLGTARRTADPLTTRQVGRASCRERVEMMGWDGFVIQKRDSAPMTEVRVIKLRGLVKQCCERQMRG